MARQKTAIVIGAGVVGITTSYALAKRGWRVTLIDKASGPCLATSHANGAQLSYCYTDALASPALLRSLPRTLLGSEGLDLTWSANIGFARWLAGFVRNCTQSRFEANTLAGLALAQESQAAMAEFLSHSPIEFSRRVAGKLHLYYSERELEHARSVHNLKKSVGCEQLELSVEETIAAEPALASVASEMVGAISTPGEEVGDPYAFSLGMLHFLQSSLGLEAIYGCAVTGLDTADKSEANVRLSDGQGLTADIAVICAASASQGLARQAGLTVPILPMKGYSFEMPVTAGSPQCSLTDTKRRIVLANLGDKVRVAGFADLGNWDASVDPEMSQRLVAIARQSFPDAGDYDRATSHWAGLRPMTPNSLPIITQPKRSLAINTGHGMLGWTLAMGSAERLAKIVMSNEP